MSGAPATTVVWLSRDTAINYAGGTTDTLPANTPAVLPDSTSTFDRTHHVWVPYCYPGEKVLRITKESLLPGLTQDYAPLARVLLHQIVSYQPEAYLANATVQPAVSGSWSGGAAILSGSQSIQGGGTYGQLLSQSIRGGGSVSGVNWLVSSDAGSGAVGNGKGSALGFFVKVHAFPSGDMALFDLNGGVSGYMRVKMTPAGHIVAEQSSFGAASSLDLGAGAISTDAWYWVTVANFSFNSHNGVRLQGEVIAPGGTALGGVQTVDTTTGNVTSNVTCTLGWGVHQSTGYQDFPNSAGNELSKLQYVYGASVGMQGAPSSDVGAGSLAALYLCRDTVGSSTCTDSTANHFDLAAGPNGLIVAADGPYP